MGPQVLKSMAASGFLVPLLRAYSMVSTATKQNNMLNTAIEPLHLGWIGHLTYLLHRLPYDFIECQWEHAALHP